MRRALTALAVCLSFSTPTFAADSQALLLSEAAGRYQVLQKSASGKATLVHDFVVRSNGAVQVISNPKLTDLREVSGSLAARRGEEMHASLSTLHLILGTGSDENVEDVHFILAAPFENTSSGVKARLTLLSTFSTSNDGPNDTGSATPATRGQYQLLKYTNGKWVQLR